MESLGLPVAKMDFKPITTDTDPNGVCQVNILECLFSNQNSLAKFKFRGFKCLRSKWKIWVHQWRWIFWRWKLVELVGKEIRHES